MTGLPNLETFTSLTGSSSAISNCDKLLKLDLK